MISLRDAAMEHLKFACETGWTLEAVLARKCGSCSPAQDDVPAIWITQGMGYLFPTRDGGERIKIKAGQIGVAFYYPDGRAEHGVFDVRKLWEEMTGERPRQLMLWAEEKEG